MKRRDFISNAVGAYIALQIPLSAFSLSGKSKKTVRIGLITDLHHDVIHNAKDRLQAFLKEMNKAKPDWRFCAIGRLCLSVRKKQRLD